MLDEEINLCDCLSCDLICKFEKSSFIIIIIIIISVKENIFENELIVSQ